MRLNLISLAGLASSLALSFGCMTGAEYYPRYEEMPSVPITQSGSSQIVSSENHEGWIKTGTLRAMGVKGTISGEIYEMSDPMFETGKKVIKREVEQ